MAGLSTGVDAGAGVGGDPHIERPRSLAGHLPALLLLLMTVGSWGALVVTDGGSRIPAAWPAAGLMAGLLLVVDRRHRTSMLGLAGVLLVLAHLVAGYDLLTAVGFSAGTSAGVLTTVWLLERGMPRSRAGLLEEGDVFRLVAGAGVGAATAAIFAAATVLVAASGSAPLALVAIFATHAASLLILVPLFVQGPEFPPIAPTGERLVQSLLTLGCSALVFGISTAPPLAFAVMPMFAWLAFRGTLREASILLAEVAVLASVVTMAGHGPVSALALRYGMAPELVTGFLQLFLIDCALILLPLSVMATQQRFAAARATSGRLTMERLVAAATGTGVIATDRSGRVTVFNPGAVTMLGRSAEEMTGIEVDLLFTDAELGRHAARLGSRPIFGDIGTAILAAEEERQLWHLQRSDGEDRTVLMSVTGIEGDYGEPTGFLCVAEDVTEREAMHRALVTALAHERAAVERLQELERVKADFVATVSHELRTPLTSMIGYVELLEDGAVGELSADQRTVVKRVESNGRRLLLLVEDLLLLSQIESRTMRVTPVRSDLRDAARAAYDALGPLLATRHLECVVRLPDRPVMLVADADHVQRLILNLVGNAVKFTPDGGRIELVVSERQDSVEVVVLDTGMGIPVDEQDQLFSRFFRSSTASAQAIQGTGLGLSIVQAIVTAHGGEVSIESSEDVGTTVSVSLPREPAPAPVVVEDQSTTP